MSLEQISLTRVWQVITDAVSAKTDAFVISLIVLVIGLFLRFVLRLAVRPLKHRLSRQAMLLLRKAISYTITLIVVITILQQFGVRLTALLGAAGIAGIAIGFAAQTSLSNCISGLFLIFEKPFQVGDIIRIGGHTGVVESIDLLSLTLRTFDNISVRLPNELLVKGELENITRHPIRRYNLELGVSYKEDPDHVLRVLRDVARKNHFVLEEPEPMISLVGFGESQLNILVGLWHEKDDFIQMRNTILRDIKVRFGQEGIEIPYPHRVIVTPLDDAPVEAKEREST